MANTFVLGLGGTGIGVVCKLLELQKTLAPEASQKIVYRVFDTDRIDYEGRGLARENVYNVTFPRGQQLVKYVRKLGWMPEELTKRASIVTGVGGVARMRPYSKALFRYYREQVRKSIIDDMARLADQTGETSFVVWIVSSLGGGTGSGMLNDFADMLGDAITEFVARYPGGRADVKLFGLGILPSAVALDEQSGGKNVIWNAYSAFRELWYQFQEKDAPFDLFFMLSLYRIIKNVKVAEDVLDFICARTILDYFFIPWSGAGQTAVRRDDLTNMLGCFTAGVSRLCTFNISYFYFPMDKLNVYYTNSRIRKGYVDRVSEYEQGLASLIRNLDFVNAKNAKMMLEDATKDVMQRESDLSKASLMVKPFAHYNLKVAKDRLKTAKQDYERYMPVCKNLLDRLLSTLKPALETAGEVSEKVLPQRCWGGETEIEVDPSGDNVRQAAEALKEAQEIFNGLSRTKRLEIDFYKDEKGQRRGSTVEIQLNRLLTLLKTVDDCAETSLNRVAGWLRAGGTRGETVKVKQQYALASKDGKDLLPVVEPIFDEIRRMPLSEIITRLEGGKPGDRFIAYLDERIDMARDGIPLGVDVALEPIPCKTLMITTTPANISDIKGHFDRIQNAVKHDYLVSVEVPENYGINICYILGGLKPEQISEIDYLHQEWKKLRPEEKEWHLSYSLDKPEMKQKILEEP